MTTPNLVEHKIKNIIHHKLAYCHTLKQSYYNILFNSLSFLFLFVTIGGFLYYKYKHNNEDEIKQRENKKRDYVLYNLRKYQNLKNSVITNIPQTNEYEY